MYNSQILTLGSLILQISMSTRYGYALNIEAIPSNKVLSTPPGASYILAVETPKAIFHQERRYDSLSAANNGTGSTVSKGRKKCSNGIKSRYCRSYHRKLKLQQSASVVAAKNTLESTAGESSTAIAETSKVVAETPQVVAETHKVSTAENSRVATETPEVAAETSKVLAVEPAKVVSQIPKAVAETAQVVAEAPHVVAEASTTSSATGTNTGDATYYGTGMGACGIVSADTSMIAAASRLLFDSFPGATANPNLNPICGRKVRATYQGKSVEVELVDRCEACAVHDLDFSPTAFAQLGAMESGRLHGMTWVWV